MAVLLDDTTRCPCCRSTSVVIGAYSRERIIRELTSLTGNTGLEGCSLPDYRLRRCQGCSLEFADPMAEPPAAFYRWLNSTHDYYPAERWEWRECRQQLRLNLSTAGTGSRMTVVDVGCGVGKFLKMIAESGGVRAIGLDVNNDAVDTCLNQGLEAVCGTLSDLELHLPDGVQAITLWHVVEHVSDPVQTLSDAASLLVSSGTIYFSVPLSPQSYESSWHDPLNAPPHHLTRWNIPALHALSATLGMKMTLILPSASSLAARVLRCLTLQAVSPFSHHTRSEKLLHLISLVARRPWLPFLETSRQIKQPRVDGKVRPDLVLACLRKP